MLGCLEEMRVCTGKSGGDEGVSCPAVVLIGLIGITSRIHCSSHSVGAA